MLKIGEFSKLSGISIFMLRHYDEINLLKPTFIDLNNSYRFYSESQLVEARKIMVLKELGYSLDEVSSIIKSMSFDEIKERIRIKLEAKKQEIKTIENQISTLMLTFDEIKKNDLNALDFIVKEIPEMAVLSYRGIIHEYQEEGRLWEKLGQLIKNEGIKIGLPPIYIAITHNYNFDKHEMDVEVQTMVINNNNPLINKTVKMKVASIVFRGEYSQLESLYPTIYQLIKKKNYAVNGKSFLMYLKSPNDESNAKEFITEICVPIK